MASHSISLKGALATSKFMPLANELSSSSYG